MRNEPNPFNVPNDQFIEGTDDGTAEGSTLGNYFVVKNLNPSSGSLHILATALMGRPERGAINGIQLVSVSAAPARRAITTTTELSTQPTTWCGATLRGRVPHHRGPVPTATPTAPLIPATTISGSRSLATWRLGRPRDRAVAVPEPSSLSLLIVLTAVALCNGNRRKNRIGS